ncbi:sugar phosphate isomerase/epimerase [Marivirga sp. S37H4]|uniref:Sugar phosphate isomerase/epimerase n=1 Tax=Marivirga aurantiaca TaxID=2802615 RepID=A0A934WZW7_9BACT|nr:sugar phosphate isomerase/epimerase [Marivirga aurantiaca]MBK6266298.1 sugar phosphate isomerase/epimerase [Marivirga aurantiaca]
MDRRKFLYQGSALAVGAFLAPALVGCSNAVAGLQNPGIQLYTLRDELAKDFAGTLKKVAELGYKNIELFNYQDGKYFGNSISEVKKMMDDHGLKVRSSHVLTGITMPENIGTLTNSWERTVEDAAKMGQEYIICAYLHDAERENLDDYRKLTDLLNKSGEVSKKYGIQMGYHNHAFEFEEMKGEIPYNILLNECDKELVKYELDLYWTKRAGVNPVDYFKEYPGRFPLWHVKDMEASQDQFFAPVGEGIIDWQNIFNHASTAGLDYYFVEQDATRDNKPFKSIEKSIKYLKGIERK